MWNQKNFEKQKNNKFVTWDGDIKFSLRMYDKTVSTGSHLENVKCKKSKKKMYSA